MAHLNPQPGDLIRHIKRGSVYEVLGHDVAHSGDMRDGRIIDRWINARTVYVPVCQQVSTQLTDGITGVVYYRSIVSAPGDPWLFSRPVSEFTTDRFEKVNLDG